MRKIFENYGGVIAVSIAIICFIALIGLMLTGSNGGWMGSAYNGLVSGFSDKVTMSLSADGGGLSGGSVDNGLNGAGGVVVTSYTAEEIDANSLLYPIGKTDPYYVVAEFNDDYSSVTITKNGENSDGLMMDWSVSATSPMKENKSTLTSAIICDGVTSVGYHAFYYCNILASVSIPDSVTDIRIGAFNTCSSLASITIPDSVISIGDTAFNACKSLTSVTIPDSVTSMGMHAFGWCSGLNNVTIGKGLTSISAKAFETCANLTSLTIPSNVTSIAGTAFTGSTKISTIYGEVGSYAETWATGKGYTFVAI